MKWTTLRLLGALFAMTLTAAACGSDAADTTTTGADTEAEDAMADDAMDDEAPDDVDDTDDDEHDVDDDGHEMDDDHDDHSGHASTIDVDPALPIPEVAITLTPTNNAGEFDMRVILANFTITPDNVDGDPIDNEGHMHFYIDGEKIDRFYDLERTITVPEGEHLIEVELNANNHAAYAVDGVPIRTSMTVEGAGEAAMDDAAADDEAVADAEDDGHDHDHDGELVGAIEGDLTVDDADIAIMATYAGGQVTGVENRTAVPLGSIVAITVIADVDEAIHLHGYDIIDDVPASDLGLIIFTADTPGRFELEFENSGTFVTELEVS